MKNLYTPFVALIVSLLSLSIQAQSTHPMARFLDTNTIVFARVQVKSFQPQILLTQFQSFANDHDQLFDAAESVNGWATDLKNQLEKAGAKEVYMFGSLSDLVSGVYFVIPGDNNLEKIVEAAEPIAAIFPGHQIQRINEGVLISSASTADRLAGNFLPQRKDATQLLNLAKSTLDIVVAPSKDHQKAMRESIGEPLPNYAGTMFTKEGLNGQILADGLQINHLKFNNASLLLELTCRGIQSAPAGGAERLNASSIIAEKVQGALDQLKEGIIPFWPRASEMESMPKSMKDALATIDISQTGNQFTIALDKDKLTSLAQGILEMARPTIQSTSQLFRMQSARNLALAIHNYEAAYAKFPQNIVDGDGKPLLSWRVAILPFLEEVELYEKFKLNEPWDSDHNRELLAEMPEFLKTTDELTEAGKTVWSRPTGEKFIGSCSRFREITDGTSNTILIIGTTPEAAVHWTQPADLKPNPEKISEGIFSEIQTTTIAAMADASGMKFSDDTTDETLSLLLMHNDGNVVDFNAIK
jgi:hypothetical protein